MAKGMMLAAGRGTRLGPLTEDTPKPLLPVANVPVMAHGIAGLRRLGIREISVNVSYRGEQILDTFGDGAAHGVRLHWLFEHDPSGTAGGAKAMQRLLGDDRVIIIAGDAMLDMDLAPLLAAHEARGALATLATIPVADPSLYGVVVTDADGRIQRFQEKPVPGTEISRQANTGIYVFEPAVFDLIPTRTFYDFALNVFPEILARGLPFYAVPLEGYWTDIGNPGDYLQANRDYLAGRIRAAGEGDRVGDNLCARAARVDGAMLHHCVVGAGAELAPGSVLTRCVVWPRTRVHAPLTLTDAVLTPAGHYQIAGRTATPLTPVPAL